MEFLFKYFNSNKYQLLLEIHELVDAFYLNSEDKLVVLKETELTVYDAKQGDIISTDQFTIPDVNLNTIFFCK